MLKIEKRIFIFSLLLTLLGTVVFFSLWNINYSFVWGWIIGCSSVILNFLLLVVLTKWTFNNFKKKQIIWLFLLKFILTSFLHALTLLLLIFINKQSSNLAFWNTGLRGINYPINLITYFCGLSVISLSIFTNNLIDLKAKKGSDNGENS